MVTFDSLIFAWMEFLSITKGQRPNTVTQYSKLVRSFFAWTGVDGLPPHSPSRITRDIIGEWMKALYYDQGNVSNQTRASKLSALRSFFAWLKYSGHIDSDPTKGIPSPKVHDKLPQKFSTEELGLLFSAPRRDKTMGIRDLAMIKTMYAAGPRVSELVKMNINHVIDSGTGYIRLQILDGKGGKGRTLTIRNNPSQALREWLIIRREIQTSDPALFIRLKGPPTRLTDRSAQMILKKYSRSVGIDDVDVFCHKLRSTFASDLYDSGNDKCPRCGHTINYVGLLEVAALLGHDDPKTTMGYVAISDRVLRKTAIPDRRFNEIEEGGRNDQTGAQRGNPRTV